jgi:cation-transporting ATPase 13A3/4/5
MCVTNQNLCPSTLAATCPPGLTFCGDGTCNTSCDNIANACQCGDTTINYFPCAAGQLVNITHFDPENQVVQIQNTCAAKAQISDASAIGAWGNFSTSSLWLSCPIVEPYFTYTEPMWIAVWSLMSAEFFILASWVMYKYFRESKFHRDNSLNNQKRSTVASIASTNEKSSVIELTSVSECKDNSGVREGSEKQHSKEGFEKSASTSIASESIKESEKLKFRGFLNDYYGFFAFGSVVVTTLLFFVFLGCIVGDYCKYF